MFMDSRRAPINVHSISKKLFTKHDNKNTEVNMFFFNPILGPHDVVLVKTFPLKKTLL